MGEVVEIHCVGDGGIAVVASEKEDKVHDGSERNGVKSILRCAYALKYSRLGSQRRVALTELKCQNCFLSRICFSQRGIRASASSLTRSFKPQQIGVHPPTTYKKASHVLNSPLSKSRFHPPHKMQ